MTRGCYCHMLRSDEGICHVCEVQTRWDDRRWHNSGGWRGYGERRAKEMGVLPPAVQAKDDDWEATKRASYDFVMSRLPPPQSAADERRLAIGLAVRAAVQQIFQRQIKEWGSVGAALVVMGYDQGSWVGQALRHETCHQFRKLTEKPCPSD